ncbi:biotin-independent malonate decarboxylase subunit gamma (plasmid) [Streptomyces sp. BI20]|uniref:biotin-independent malonate decarboxylase subunit gamma n=1 Tax=Streptomyces sp. BI20 TaxID=3403460 RepID=UPI003C763E4B
MTTDPRPTPDPTASRGRTWFARLTATGTETEAGATSPGPIGSVLSAPAPLGDTSAWFLAVVPDPQGRFPRAHRGEVGLEEGWHLAAEVRAVVEADADLPPEAKRPVVAIVDVPSQAYGHREELVGIHQALAAAVDAYATARLAGHPVIAFVVGNAISGAFLAHGLQADRIIALDDEAVQVQVMSKQATARITRRTLAELAEAAEKVPATAYDGASFAKLGALHRLIPGDCDTPTALAALAEAAADARRGPHDLSPRLTSPEALRARAASVETRRRLAASWEG